ncbi:MAG TPA: MBL fold metallo-hydrolase [Chitinophagales bacterium]|nr:MBL fold metallo-hydrolase [Chitinophagales bacterium]
MLIRQFEDNYLSHFSYAILHDGKAALIDPARNPLPYYDFAKQHAAQIVAVIETHLHADFVSSHVEMARTTGAGIFIHPAAQPEFEFHPFDDHALPLKLGGISLKAISTPGHSPDSICILLNDAHEEPVAVFSGDTLFIGDVGRPDLRETTFTRDATREKSARQLYHSVHEKLLTLPDRVLVYPAHGAGSLCGKYIHPQNSTTIGAERLTNTSLQPMSEDAFVEILLTDLPPAPKYFPHSVTANRKKELMTFREAVESVSKYAVNKNSFTVIDSRLPEDFRKSHLPGSLNIPDDTKFETWVGTLISPEEEFVLAGYDNETLAQLSERIVNIGYESNFKGWLPLDGKMVKSEPLNVSDFASHPNQYIIIDVRNPAEVREGKIFEASIHLPLQHLRERLNEIPSDRPVVTHCAGGTRGAIAASILESSGYRAYDLGAATKKFASLTP